MRTTCDLEMTLAMEEMLVYEPEDLQQGVDAAHQKGDARPSSLEREQPRVIQLKPCSCLRFHKFDRLLDIGHQISGPFDGSLEVPVDFIREES